MIAPSPDPDAASKRRVPRVDALLRAALTRTRLLLGASAALALVAAAAGGDLGGGAVRALAVVAFLGVGVVALRRGRALPQRTATLEVQERQPIGRDSGVALVQVGSRRYLVGYGPAGVALLAPMDPATEGPP